MALKSGECGTTLALIVLSTPQDWPMPFMSYMFFIKKTQVTSKRDVKLAKKRYTKLMRGAK
ncbi:hypothetical protein AF72_04540 [Xylella taiwanensis]|uniref:Uncharacterized protein n=1 Tax=Xylella taiwanensis TaxID=1444770 RepID=Z9JLD3_9GAMM|nr:hypothetical protein AF72_04540 [Xylella taiwanensis]